jgi:hypothetical protein
VRSLDRAACRAHVRAHFSAQRMTDGYEAVYQQLVTERFAQNGHSAASLVSSLK